ncbi:MAG: hypothetical protein NC221_07610 [Duncaniella sp.]|nr:hypothetical protein [Muribaculum sp.]MCM1255969.1 hypothetical protein [Duncaniella sp.]
MNQIFNISRFGMLFKKNIIEDWRRILLMFGGMVGCMLLVVILIAHLERYSNAISPAVPVISEGGWFVIIIFISGLIITSGLFKSLGRPVSALNTLMCPASGFEKFLMRWISGVPLFIIGSLLAAMLCDWFRVLYTGLVIHQEAMYMPWGSLLLGGECLSYPDGIFWGLVLMYMFYQSIYMVGAVFFSKNHFLKTFASIFVVGAVYTLFAGLLIVAFLRKNDVYNELDWDTIAAWVWAVVTVFNYLTVYVRVRELEIINRW